ERIAALDLEAAVASASRLLERPGLADADRADALALRAGAHVAAGELDAAEADYKAILPLRPDFAPDPALTSKKSMERLARLQAQMVATVHLDLDPADARLTVDERPVVLAGTTLKVLAGERRLHAERTGFDPLDVPVRAVAGAETLLQLRLVPNARGLLIRTDVPAVEVILDGARVGETMPGTGGASLLVPDLPIGEHTVELRKLCFATETLPAMINVDLADRSPKALALVTMRPAAARITPTGAGYPGELRVDGAKTTSPPGEPFTVCPGSRAIEVVASGRVVWSGTIEAEETDRTLDLSPRPNVVLVGDEWPAAWRDFAGAVSLRGRVNPDPGSDLSTLAGWKGVALPKDTDLAVAVRDGKVWLFAPAMGAMAPADRPPGSSRPRWSGARLDASLVDADGGIFVAEGLSPGDRVLGVDGKDVASAAELAKRLDATTPGGTVTVRLSSPGGEARTVQVPVLPDPRPITPADRVEAIVRSAWASSEGAAGGAEAASALASLATLLEGEHRLSAAAEAWRRAKALDPKTFGVRADYAIAADLASQGKKAEAIEAFRRVREAAQGEGDAILAFAASDHLADLGVSAP
ncbi:MAG TPA: PDZ domain-containing protein, partial [Candidatus Polarisedimenticolaceae bacterium]|nr:PDZ domain-containing protein [Candidatus Polarisedimenticolaceae bacterium]